MDPVSPPSPGGPRPRPRGPATPRTAAIARACSRRPPTTPQQAGLTDATLARALTDEVLAARLIDEVIANLPEGTPRRPRKPRVYPAAVIPFGHGLAALATFTLAVITAVGTR